MSPSIRRSAIGLCLFLTAGVAPSQAQDAPAVAVSADLDFRSRYLFAGVPFSTGEVIQATVNVGYGSWTFHAFGSFDADLTAIAEADVWGDYYHQLSSRVGGFVGGAWYNFKIGESWEPTFELYGGLVVTAPGTPTLYYARDFDLTTGDHFSLTLSHTIPVGAVAFQGTGRIEYNNGYYREGSSFSYVDFKLAIPVTRGPMTVSPLVVLQGALVDAFENRVVFGVNAHLTMP